jgi:hypothetical protein
MTTKHEINNCSTCILCKNKRIYSECNHPAIQGKDITAFVHMKTMYKNCPLKISDLLLTPDIFNM